MTPQDWDGPVARTVTIAMSGDTGDQTRPDDAFLLMLNASWEPLDFTIPESLRGPGCEIEVDTFDPGIAARTVDTSTGVTLNGPSLVLLRGGRPRPERSKPVDLLAAA